MKNSDSREDWLMIAVNKFSTDLFKPHGFKLPKVRVSVGLPYGRGSKKAIGQHWHPDASDDKVGAIFISPTIVDGVEVLGTLIHEMVHAAVGNEAKHGPLFRKCALAVGLEGKMKATVAGEGLSKTINKFVKETGAYPHSKLNLGMRPTKKQTTRMVKMECDGCGFIARAALTKIIEVGAPSCACNGEQLRVEIPEGEE